MSAPAPDPLRDLILSIGFVADRAGYSHDEANEIAWLVMDALKVARESGPWADRPTLRLVEPRQAPEPDASGLAALVNDLRPLLRLVPDPEPRKAPKAKSLTDAELIERYADYQRRRNLSKGTVEVRRSHLVTFAAAHRGGFGTVTRQQVDEFLDGRNLSARTRAWNLSCLHVFYAWAIDEGVLESDPTAKIRRPKLDKTLPRPIPDVDLRRAIELADPQTLCWLLLGAYGGLRCKEIAGLSVEDVLADAGTLRIVRGKGAKDRMVPLHADVLAALRALPMPASGAVFRRKNYLDRYPAAQLVQEFNAYLRSLGIKSTAHTCRHWFASTLYQATHDLRLVQELLGHTSPETTAIYTKLDQSAAAGAVSLLGV